ncbi:MAG: radical SAM protein [Coriobacteriales bacterium]|jgi:nitrogen fixation protein NifB|nr:radical SAM protein [Coriobacteriales bacterium]
MSIHEISFTNGLLGAHRAPAPQQEMPHQEAPGVSPHRNDALRLAPQQDTRARRANQRPRPCQGRPQQNSFARLARQHPCFAQGRSNGKGRIHLPVSPGCTINCRFCERSINRHEQRPGVTARRLKPKEALEVVARSLDLAPELSVVGIAGPGDPLATPYALETFRLIQQRFPQMIRCLSTNGLLLADQLDDLLEAGVDTLTVTVNDIEPRRLAQIVDRVTYQGRRYGGTEAARLLIDKQLAGIHAAANAGLLIKVNTVLIPHINGLYIGAIARRVKQAGAGLYNIIPLIPNAQMAQMPAPTCAQIDAARSAAEQHISVFRHCQHCRADAIGIPGGKDLSEFVYKKRKINQSNTFSHG